MTTQSQYRDVKTPLREGIESLQKWYNRVDETSSAYFICLGKVHFLFLMTCLVFTFVIQFLILMLRIFTAVTVGNRSSTIKESVLWKPL